MASRGRFRMGLNKIAKEVRQKFAKERAEVRAKLDAVGQLQVLDVRLGKGVGAVKERLRLGGQVWPEKTAPEASQAAGEALGDEIEGVQLLQVGGRAFLKLEGRQVPLQSMSQLRRIGQQEGFDPAPFVKAMKTHLEGGGSW